MRILFILLFILQVFRKYYERFIFSWFLLSASVRRLFSGALTQGKTICLTAYSVRVFTEDSVKLSPSAKGGNSLYTESAAGSGA